MKLFAVILLVCMVFTMGYAVAEPRYIDQKEPSSEEVRRKLQEDRENRRHGWNGRSAYIDEDFPRRKLGPAEKKSPWALR